MARIKYFEALNIAIYIYGEKNNPHHKKHLLVLKPDEHCQYGFDGMPMKGTSGLKRKEDRKVVESWIKQHQSELDKAWDDINNGINPGVID